MNYTATHLKAVTADGLQNYIVLTFCIKKLHRILVCMQLHNIITDYKKMLQLNIVQWLIGIKLSWTWLQGEHA